MREKSEVDQTGVIPTAYVLPSSYPLRTRAHVTSLTDGYLSPTVSAMEKAVEKPADDFECAIRVHCVHMLLTHFAL